MKKNHSRATHVAFIALGVQCISGPASPHKNLSCVIGGAGGFFGR